MTDAERISTLNSLVASLKQGCEALGVTDLTVGIMRTTEGGHDCRAFITGTSIGIVNAILGQVSLLTPEDFQFLVSALNSSERFQLQRAPVAPTKPYTVN